VEAPTAIDCHRSAQREDCKFTVMTKKKSKIPRSLEKKIQERKKTFPSEIKSVILDNEYVETPKGFHINVVSNILKNDQSCSTA